jgi:hypothetical protein
LATPAIAAETLYGATTANLGDLAAMVDKALDLIRAIIPVLKDEQEHVASAKDDRPASRNCVDRAYCH